MIACQFQMEPPLIIYNVDNYDRNCGFLCDPKIFEFTILQFKAFFLANI